VNMPFPPSTNNLFINVAKGRIPSARYADWRQEAGWSLKAQRPRSIKGPVILKYLFQEGQDRRKRDIGNLEKAATDLLVEHKVIESDDNTIVRAIALGWSKNVTGARVEIIPVSEA
ncbi:TPA: RusA family crossover junction endodeoxyribonuclease, partial [Staphylococcus aureus]|nr:RusA family crossover junction endodeoxyribonuclease [Staphylococcus aureus]